MDAFEAEKVVHDRIKQLEPHVAKKIIGYMLLQEIPEEEMIRLALGPDSLILNLIQNAKTAIFIPSSPLVSPSISPTGHFTPFSLVSPRHFSAPASFRRLSNLELIPYSDSEYGLPDSMTVSGSRNALNIMDHPVKSCHYFNKGFCKHGSNCRYFHGESFPESYPHAFGPSLYEANSEDQVFYPGSLEKLELEVIELLKSLRGNPVSIASLPMMYYEKYGRTLQADGYLSESQRHGKAGYSLTKLLARLNGIRLIDRPHGQHAVILAEDAQKYADIQGERNEPGPIVSGSRQIYLTFPAESTFSEEDVSNYFSAFGPVQDVRIPCQQKRMFGFVTFVSANTVKLILSKGNPHYVCGARVLVKPYREKSKLVERKYIEKLDPPIYYRSHPIDIDSKLQSRSYRLFKRQLMEEHDNAIELETRHLSQLQLTPNRLASQFCSRYSMDELKLADDHPKFPSPEHYTYLFDDLNNGSTSGNNPKYPVSNCSDQESAQGLNLPDSPFASGATSSISAVM